MDFVKIFVSLMILFVAVNLLLTIYRLLNRKWREGLENADTECGPDSYCQNPLKPGAVCHGTTTPCGANPLVASSVTGAATNGGVLGEVQGALGGWIKEGSGTRDTSASIRGGSEEALQGEREAAARRDRSSPGGWIKEGSGTR
ncbi:MAG: hypothetical protein CXT73_03355, partial [Methanobacteriota archaeon]